MLGISRAKDAFIQRAVKARIDAGEDITKQPVVNAVLSDIAAELKMNPSKPLDTRSSKELTEIAKKKVEKAFPKSLAQLKKELTEEAQKRFIQYKLRSNIRIRYYRGPNILAASGPFYSFNGRVVKIGSKTIPYYDILPEDKIKIDKKYSDAKRQEFINSRYNAYRDRRNEAILKELNTLKDDQEKANENAGYINMLDKWYSPRQLADLYIRKEQLRITSAKTDAMDSNEILTFDKPDEKVLTAKIAKMKTDVEKCRGIDNDQGYAPAYWGFTRGEARAALQAKNYSLMATKAYDFFVTPNRQIRNIQLDYVDNKLSRVITFYTRVSLADFRKLKEQYLGRYGQDDYLKSNLKEDPKNRLRPLIWTGKHTSAKLMLEFDDDDEVASAVLFIKEKTGAYPKEQSMLTEKKKTAPKKADSAN